MINRHKLHIIVEQELCIYQNVDLRTKKAQKVYKIVIISKREILFVADAQDLCPVNLGARFLI